MGDIYKQGREIASGTSYADPQGATHAAFPFRSESTDKFYVITADELSGLSVGNAYEAVRRLRPAWLLARGRSPLPVVYRNDTRWGDDPRSLESIQIDIVSEMRFMSATDATTRYGSGFTGGLILVVAR